MKTQNEKTAVVVIPTYNEKESIGKMIDYLFSKIIPVKNWILKILIVDGQSPDGTAEEVKKRKEKYKDLFLYEEKEKEGIGAAYIKGFKYAVNELDADVVFEFDGDFQHPPETIPVMLEEIDNGYDYVLGSRRVKGGGFPENWGLKRLFFSVFGGFVARMILFFPTKDFFKVTDPTTGLKATRVYPVLNKINYEQIYSRGFGYKLEWLFRTVKSGANVKEIPLNFKLREEGESKITGQTPVEILKTVIRLRCCDKETRRFVKFGIVGFIGFLVNAVFMEVFRNSIAVNISDVIIKLTGKPINLLSNPSSWAAGMATEMAIISNYILNNNWTFSDRKLNRIKHVLSSFLKFNLTSFGAIIIQFVFIGLATILISDTVFVRQVSLILAIGLLVVPYNWLMYNKIIWKKKRIR